MSNGPPGQKWRFLIVEDDADLREMMAQLLLLEGFTAQAVGETTRRLDTQGANGGPGALVTLPFFISINSSVNFLLPGLEPPGGLRYCQSKESVRGASMDIWLPLMAVIAARSEPAPESLAFVTTISSAAAVWAPGGWW